MATFTDGTGRVWEIHLTAGDLKRIKRPPLSLDLRDALKPGSGNFTEALDDPDRFLELMWALCGRQATIGRDDFESLFDRATTVAAVAAVWESVWDFFRGQRAGVEARKTLLAAVDQIESASESLMVRATERVKAGPTSSEPVNSSPELSASTIDPSPSPS